jgi:hypothetical protein
MFNQCNTFLLLWNSPKHVHRYVGGIYFGLLLFSLTLLVLDVEPHTKCILHQHTQQM